MQQTVALTPKKYFTMLTLLHAALFGTQLLVGAVFYYLNSNEPLATEESVRNLDGIFVFIVPAFILASYLGSSVLVKAQLKELRAKASLQQKLTGYSSLLLIQFALLEIPALFSIVCFVLTGNYLYLGAAALVMLVFLINRPNRYRTANDLDLTPAERTLLENPDAVIR